MPRLAQLRKPIPPQSRYPDRRRAADNHRRYGPEGPGREAGAEFAKLVRGADEYHVHRVDTPAHRVGCPELDQRLADIDAHHVETAHQAKRQHRQLDLRRGAKHGDEETDQGNADEHDHAGMVFHGMAQHEGRHQDRTDAGCCAQKAEPPGADGENIARIDGRSAVAPPSSMAKRSKEMAPSTIFSFQM